MSHPTPIQVLFTTTLQPLVVQLSGSLAHGTKLIDQCCHQELRIWSRITSRIAEAVVSFPRSKFWIKECGMDGYAAEVEQKMQRFFGWLSEKDRRRYAAVEAAKLGHGGVEYIARVLACDPQTIRHGLRELEEAEDAATGRIRKKGADARRAPSPSRP